MSKNKIKIIIDYFWAYHNVGQGLLEKDHSKISKDLKKIAKIPFMAKSSPYEFPFRVVKIITDSSRSELKGLPKKIFNEVPRKFSHSETGRLLGYKIVDYSWGSIDKTNKEEINKWYNNARHPQNYLGPKVEKIFSLSELEKL